MRGENAATVLGHSPAQGSSPHARGKLRGIVGSIRPVGLIPACAGKTTLNDGDGFVVGAHPRMRGENHSEVGAVLAGRGSSPHARGKPLGCVPIPERGGLIPACAGKTHCMNP